jgi:ribonuclease P protein component
MPAGPRDERASPFDALCILTASARAGVLRQPREFEAVLRSGVRVSTRNFVARALANGVDRPRLGMIAGKKAATRAVDRNRAKRLIREMFRCASPGFGAYDVAIQLRSDLRSHDNEFVRAELRHLLDTLARRCAADAARAPTPGTSPGTSPRTSPDRQ